MRKVVLVFSLFMVFVAIYANTNMNFRFDFTEFTNEDWGEFSKSVTSQIHNLRELYALECLYEDWIDEAWVYEGKDIYTYDGSSYPIEILMLVWEDNAWQNSMKMVMTNNVQGYPTEMMYKMWEPTSQIWMDMALISNTYDANMNLTEMLTQLWYLTEWVNSSRFTMTYNNDDNPTHELQETWDFIGGGTEWENSHQETYTYDGLFLEQILDEVWENDSEWIWNEKITYTEAGNYYPADRLDQGWDLINWNNDRYNQYTYDGDWNEIEDLQQDWDEGAWVNHQIHYYTYDGDLLIERLTHEWEADRSWVNHDRYTVTYGTLDSEENTVIPGNLSLSNYPNPFNPETTIDFSIKSGKTGTLEIFNLKGQMILSQEFTSGDHSFIWNALNQASGIYFYKMKTDYMTTTKKMILMK